MKTYFWQIELLGHKLRYVKKYNFQGFFLQLKLIFLVNSFAYRSKNLISSNSDFPACSVGMYLSSRELKQCHYIIGAGRGVGDHPGEGHSSMRTPAESLLVPKQHLFRSSSLSAYSQAGLGSPDHSSVPTPCQIWRKPSGAA